MVRFLGKIRNERHAVKATHLNTTDLAALDDDDAMREHSAAGLLIDTVRS